ncbi:MAG: RNA polymerase sigma factor RpoD/SigA [Planctomycetes bacterium]|nr:RNA polymerase sigma factor RpoD/SigA [Planctomycetota bacterium]
MKKPGWQASGPNQAPLGTYLREINETPLLSEQEEKDLAARIADGDLEARDQMVRANLRLVVNIARGYSGKGLGLEDLIAEGNLGLLRAVEGFDPGMNTRFSTYASFWIKQSIRRSLAASGKTIRIPTYMATLLAKWRRATNQLHNEKGSPPTQEEVASYLGLSKKKFNIVKKAIRVYNSAPASDPGDSSRPVDESFIDLQANAPETGLMATDDVQQVLALVEGMEPREAAILRMRFGLNGQDPKTLKEVGDELGLTRERVRQLERDALKKLGHIMQAE